MGQRIRYTVTATLPSGALAEGYVAWLRGGHVQGVLDGGAEAAEIVRLDATAGDHEAGTVRIQTVYTFPSREAFAAYERDHAPALRADGLKRFGPESGHTVTFRRTVGEVLS